VTGTADVLGAAYGRIAHLRRQWYARHPEARRRLDRAVVSVGNLTVGGSGKTPTVAYLASLLAGLGERPAILSRGYGRQRPEDGVVVVSTPDAILADVARAGDEPLMLATAVEQACVLVAADRFLAGRLAERRLGATVHLLDDGFQHFQLARDVDLLLVDPADLEDARLLPRGRLREPLTAAANADAALVSDGDEQGAKDAGSRLGVRTVFSLHRLAGTPRFLEPRGVDALTDGQPVVAMAAVARPDRFFAELEARGLVVASRMTFRDHHAFTAADARAMAESLAAAGAGALVTTEKDAMRLLPLRPLPFPVASVPLAVRVEPDAAFREWLVARLAGARTSGSPAADGV
jgi:tetraacyldisaccharide 4'-kinase